MQRFPGGAVHYGRRRCVSRNATYTVERLSPLVELFSLSWLLPVPVRMLHLHSCMSAACGNVS